MRARIESKTWCGSYAVTSSHFELAVVGAKSLNTAALKVGHHFWAVGTVPNIVSVYLPDMLYTMPCHIRMCVDLSTAGGAICEVL